MAKSLEELDRLRPVDPAALAGAVAELREQERAWQLRELRKTVGFTQAELADVLKVRQNRISQIESGGAEHARLDTLRNYANALGGTLNVEIAIGDKKYQVA